jgi:1,4-dihydroxy-2-naphthoate octaprenyltransferase
MNENHKGNLFINFFQIFKIWDILFALIFYILGSVIARFTGAPISWLRFFIGLTIIIFIFLAYFFLEKRFSLDRNLIISERLSDSQNVRSLTSTNLLQISLGFLAVAAFFVVFMLINRGISVTAGIILFLVFILIICIAVPPIRLIQKGLSEIAFAILLGNFVPGFAFFLQSSEYSRILLSATLPLSFLILASRLAISLEQYGKNDSLRNKSMMESMGWQKGILFHNIIILVAFILIGIFGIIGQPWKITWPGLLVLPIGVFEIWQLWKITQGAKPHWKLLKLTANVLVFLAAYFISLSAWIR